MVTHLGASPKDTPGISQADLEPRPTYVYSTATMPHPEVYIFTNIYAPAQSERRSETTNQ